MVNKVCKKCKLEKPIFDFHKRSRCKDGYAIYCKDCNRQINKKSYHTYWSQRRKAIDNYHYNRIEQLRLEIDTIKVNRGCFFCGYNKYALGLDFHHLNEDTKLNSIAALINRKVNKDKLYNEIDKCIVVCAICHRLVHSGILTYESKNLSH
jgi:hypothetical protein